MHIGVIDVNSHAITYIHESISPSMTYQGGVLAGNGNIYFCPDQMKRIGVLERNHFSTIYHFSTIDIERRLPEYTYNYFSGCVLHTDGMIYFIPGESEFIWKLDPSTRVFSKLLDLRNFIDPGKNEAFYNASGWGGDRKTNKFSGGVSIGPDKIYLIPSNTRNIGLLTLYPTLTFELITDVGVGDLGYRPFVELFEYKGGVELFGEIYMTSSNKNQLDVIDLNLPILSSCTIIPTTPPITTPPTTIPPLVAPPTTIPPLVAPPTTTPPPQAPPQGVPGGVVGCGPQP